jgi:hypothetical protein
MFFGSPDDFAIECYRQDLPADYGHDVSMVNRDWVFGRMCVWCGGQRLGDIDDINMLDVTEACFESLAGRIAGLTDPAVDGLDDSAAFDLLDNAIYGEDGRTDEQVHEDYVRFEKFKFLIDEGEQFDHLKAYLLNTGNGLRVLYRREGETVGSAKVREAGLRHAVDGFLAWVRHERELNKWEKASDDKPRTDHGQ